MLFKQKLSQITQNPAICTKLKIHLVQGLKHAIIKHISQYKKSEAGIHHSFKGLAQNFDSSYKDVNLKIIKTQKDMLKQHKKYIQLFTASQSNSERLQLLMKLEEINQNLRNLLQQVKNKKDCLQQLSNSIEDHLKFKKTKLQVQLEKKVCNLIRYNDKRNSKENKKYLGNISLISSIAL